MKIENSAGAIVEKEGVTVDLNAARWIKSTLSSGNCDNCVEVAFFPGAAAVRDSKDPNGGVLVYTSAEWIAFVGGILAGEFDA